MVSQPDLKREDILKSRENAQLFVTDEVAIGLTIAPALNRVVQAGRRYNFYKRDKTSKQIFEEFFTDEPMKVAKGAQLTKVSGTEQIPDSEPLLTAGFRYIVPKEDYNESPESFLMDIEDMCYVIRRAIELSVVDAVNTHAPAPSSRAHLHDGEWNDSTMISEDIRGFRMDYRSRGIRGPLDKLFYETDNHDELGNFIIRTEGNQNLKETGDVIDYASVQNTYAENGPAHGTTFGWSTVAVPGSIVYRAIPGAYTPIKTKPGTELPPVINMKIIESDGEGMEGVLDMRFGAHWTVAMQRPNNIFRKDGL